MFSVPLALLMHALNHPLVFLCPAQKINKQTFTMYNIVIEYQKKNSEKTNSHVEMICT